MPLALTPLAFATAAMWILTTMPAPAITPQDLRDQLAKGQPVHLIDVRPTAIFQNGSIPGAMSIPASVILQKQLPPLAPAVLFDDGLGDTRIREIAAELNKRPGWKADVLTGGFAAWRALPESPDTAHAGLRTDDTRQITYDKLNVLDEPVAIVDLRPTDPATTNNPKAKAAPGTQHASAQAADPVSEFCKKQPNRSYLPNVSSLRSRFGKSTQSQGKSATPGAKSATTPPLLVLVAPIDEDARETRRRLIAEGYPRVLILAGGDEAIRLEGRRGLGRISGSVGEAPARPQPSTQAPSPTP